jgi:DNA mismatch repair protein MutS2
MRLHPPAALDKLGFTTIRDSVREACSSVMGSEWMDELSPSSEREVVAVRLERTRELMAMRRYGEALPLPDLADPREALKRARPEGTVLDPDSILRVFHVAATSRRVRQSLIQRADSAPTLAAWAEPLVPLKEVEDRILAILTDTGVVRDNASPELQQIRRSLQSRRNDLRTTLTRIARQAAKDGFLAENEPTIRAGRMVLAIRAEHKRHLSGFLHDTSATGQTVYIEPAEALHIHNDIRTLEAEEAREIDRLLRILTGVIREHRLPLERNTALLGELDGMRAIAAVCVGWDGTPAVLRTDDRIDLIAARNPVLMGKSGAHAMRPYDVIPLDLTMERDERGLVITGPNAGGKSVAMKTLGLCVLLTQCGFAIPAGEGSGLPVFGMLAVDMGDDQSIENDLSTFSSRLTWMKDLVVGNPPTTHHPPPTLVLIDEAASGTDPEEGVALYRSLMEILLERGARMVVTTHHGALKVFANDHPGMVNGSMAFDPERLQPTFVFRKGLPGSSYAFEIAQRTGVPTALTDRARALLGDSRNKLETLIGALDASTNEAAEHAARLEGERKAARRLEAEYRQKLETLHKEKDKIRAKALEEAKAIMMEANRTVERVVEEIRTANASTEAIKKARADLRKGASHAPLASHAPTTAHRTGASHAAGVGSLARIIGTDTVGDLLELNGKNAVLMVNGLRVRVKADQLESVDRRQKTVDSRQRAVDSRQRAVDSRLERPLAVSRIDLRGSRAEEAVAKVERFMDEGIAAGLHQLDIVHGKGDGILRKRIQAYLQTRTDITGFADAPWDQGGPGVTVVEVG